MTLTQIKTKGSATLMFLKQRCIMPKRTRALDGTMDVKGYFLGQTVVLSLFLSFTTCYILKFILIFDILIPILKSYQNQTVVLSLFLSFTTCYILKFILIFDILIPILKSYQNQTVKDKLLHNAIST
uniref:Uncharacterized protein n=1 Tax=Anthurium amnicola TaxID=1678845 RepID=A0A1D1YY42_9ARAE